MPSIKNGTITENFITSLYEFNSGKFEYKADKNNIIHIIFGKANFTDIKLKENLIYIYNEIKKNKPLNIKGKYIDTFYICNTMSPSIRLFIS
jgi:large subunit ribosomal protein L1